jgi:hypothetical protein
MTDHDHSDLMARKLGNLDPASDFPSDSITPTTATGKGIDDGETFSPPAARPEARVNDESPVAEKPRCTGTTQAGAPCKSYALGEAYGAASHLCISHARGQGLYVLGSVAGKGSSVSSPVSQQTAERVGDSAKWLSERAGAASRTRTPLAVLREKVEADPDKYVALWEKAAERGSDIRALSAIFKLIYEDDAGHVDEPHSFDEFARLTRTERRQLLTQLEQEGRGSPFRADSWRAAMAKDELERRAELSTLSQEERRILVKDLAALEGSP